MIKGHVLIVDDEPSNLMLMEELFHQRGARVYAAPDGPTALAQQERPDIVLLDVMMSGVNGYEAAAGSRPTRPPGAYRW